MKYRNVMPYFLFYAGFFVVYFILAVVCDTTANYKKLKMEFKI